MRSTRKKLWLPPNVWLHGSQSTTTGARVFKNGQQAGLGTVPTGGYNQVYIQPPHRYFNFDQGFKERTPAGAPTLTGFTRGDFFFWQ